LLTAGEHGDEFGHDAFGQGDVGGLTAEGDLVAATWMSAVSRFSGHAGCVGRAEQAHDGVGRNSDAASYRSGDRASGRLAGRHVEFRACFLVLELLAASLPLVIGVSQ
jgi:hypothetical protein